MKKCITYGDDPSNFYVEYQSPSRPLSDLRSEFNLDAQAIAKHHGPVYLGFSGGVDCQIILRCFLDLKLDVEPVFMHVVGCNEHELSNVEKCEKYYGVKVKKYQLHLDQFKDKWLERRNTENVFHMKSYPFEWLSSVLPETWPLIMQGITEPAVVGSNSSNASIYHSYHEAMNRRFKLMQKYRTMIDFPFSPEAVTRYYTDEAVKGFCQSIQYYSESYSSYHLTAKLETDPKRRYLQFFNGYAKGIVKGKYFNDILWFGKSAGDENYPDWLVNTSAVQNTKVLVPYWELVEFLEKLDDTTIKFYCS